MLLVSVSFFFERLTRSSRHQKSSNILNTSSLFFQIFRIIITSLILGYSFKAIFYRFNSIYTFRIWSPSFEFKRHSSDGIQRAAKSGLSHTRQADRFESNSTEVRSREVRFPTVRKVRRWVIVLLIWLGISQHRFICIYLVEILPYFFL